MLLRLCAAALAAATVSACATNPATGRREITLMSEAQEIALGKESDAQVRQEMGLYDDPDLQRYVSGIGLRLAKLSERPNLPWQFAVVDQAAVNAFALPGGFIYVTRGILPYLDSEAELAGVLGHEIGHVTARHAAQQYTRQIGGTAGLIALGVFVPAAQPFTQASQQAMGLLFLKYGRDDELQADSLGVRYAGLGNWDPEGVPAMLTTLGRLDEAAGDRKGVPNFLSTHPEPLARVKEIGPEVQKAKAGKSGFVTDRAGHPCAGGRRHLRRQPGAGHRARYHLPASAAAFSPRFPDRLAGGQQPAAGGVEGAERRRLRDPAARAAAARFVGRGDRRGQHAEGGLPSGARRAGHNRRPRGSRRRIRRHD
jgi:predicted Zn-dependent protease